MRKFLLSVVAMTFALVGGVNSQTRVLGEGQEYLVLKGSTTMTGEDENNAMMVQYFGDDWKIEATYAKFDKEILKEYAGYNIVGVSVAGAFAVKAVPCYIKTAVDDKTVATNLAETTLESAVPSVLALKKFNWNDAFFEKAYTIPTSADEIEDVYAGYSLLDADGNMKTKQILVGEPVSDNEDDMGCYLQQNNKISGLGHNVLPVKLILEKTATSINTTTTTTTAKETGRYTMDGKRIYLPVKGINIVKMSDGTVRKVVNK